MIFIIIGIIGLGCSDDVNNPTSPGGQSGIIEIWVSPSSIWVYDGDIVDFNATGIDCNGNYVGITPSWSAIGGIGTIDSDGKFTAAVSDTDLHIGWVYAFWGALSDYATVTVQGQ